MKKVKNIILLIIISTLFFGCNQEKNIKKNNKNFFLLNISADIDSNAYVLAPTRANIDSAKAKGLDNVIFVFYPRKVISSLGNRTIINEYGDSVDMPSALVIPLSKNKKVAKGQFLLTWWQKATGMQRAIVLNKDSSNKPVVFYLDNFTTPSSSQTMLMMNIDTLKINSFLPIKNDSIMPGRSFMNKADQAFNIVINSDQDSVIGLTWAGMLNVVSIENCVFSKPDMKLNVGDTVILPYVGSYQQAVLKNVWSDIGKVKADVFFLDTIFETYANICDIIPNQK